MCGITSCRLFARLVEDALAERTYTASLAGLHYSVSGNTDGLYIDISGYSHKLSVLLDTILKEIKTFSIDAGRFAVHAEQVNTHQSLFERAGFQ